MASGVPHQGVQTQSLPPPPNGADDYRDRHVEGYPRLAWFFAKYPRTLHLRHFAALSIRNLLYRQHRLAVLEEQLLETEKNNAQSRDTDRLMCVRDFQALRDPEGPEQQEIKKQRALYEDVQKELKEYEDALIRYQKLGQTGYKASEIEKIQKFQGPGKSCLVGRDALIWGVELYPNSFADDIFQVLPSEMESRFMQWVRNSAGPWVLQRCNIPALGISRAPDAAGLHTYSNSMFDSVAYGLGSSITFTIMEGALAALYLAPGRFSSLAMAFGGGVAVLVCVLAFRNLTFVLIATALNALLWQFLANRDGKPHQ